MNYKIYKMMFSSGVHFGNRIIESSDYTFHADTLFSALCHEAVKNGEDTLDRLYSMTKNGELLLSDALPFCEDVLYIPKPMLRVEYEEQGDSAIKKAFKNLSYIPADKVVEYRTGKLEIKREQSVLEQLGILYSRNMAAVRGKEETEPYRVGVFRFMEGNGLYIIVGYKEESHRDFLEDLLDRLSFAGIGGKRSAGLGRFELRPCKLSEDIHKRLANSGEIYMTLSVALPAEQEMEEVLSDANYQMIKRSGFVASDCYADEFLRKKDLYVMNAGACVCTRFEGDIYDVSSGGSHAVYRYAKPLLLEVDV